MKSLMWARAASGKRTVGLASNQLYTVDQVGTFQTPINVTAGMANTKEHIPLTIGLAIVRRGSRGRAKGALPPPPHTKLLPQIVRRGSRGAKRALAPPLQNPGSAYDCSHLCYCKMGD